jgi:hypothetical protein
MAVKSFSLGMAVGYVLGARAGERRYEQIVNWSQKLLDSPLAERLTSEGRDIAINKARQVVDTVKTRGLRDFDGGHLRQRDDDEDERSATDEYDDEDEEADRDDEDGQDDYETTYARDRHEQDDRKGDEEDERTYARNRRDGRDDRQDENDEDEDEQASGRGGLGFKLGGMVASARDRGRVD